MKPLEKQFLQKGLIFTQIERTENLAYYEVKETSGRINDEAFGRIAWSISSKRNEADIRWNEFQETYKLKQSLSSK